MGYELRTKTPPRSEGLWARHAHTVDSFLSDTSFYQNSGSLGGAAWPTANLIIYVPVRLKIAVLARKLFYSSQTVGTGNIDIGVYNRAGSRLVNSGSTAKSTTNALVFVDTTDTRLKPDLYYVALQSSNNTDTFNRTPPAAPYLAYLGVRSEAAGGFGLPATATWVVDQALAYLPHVGISIGSVY
jgi:hypothetical protein